MTHENLKLNHYVTYYSIMGDAIVASTESASKAGLSGVIIPDNCIYFETFSKYAMDVEIDGLGTKSFEAKEDAFHAGFLLRTRFDSVRYKVDSRSLIKFSTTKAYARGVQELPEKFIKDGRVLLPEVATSTPEM